MKRAEIEKLNSKLGQIKDLEYMLDELQGRGQRHWWEIKTPEKNTSLRDEGSRKRFLQFVETEIEILKKEISLEE